MYRMILGITLTFLAFFPSFSALADVNPLIQTRGLGQTEGVDVQENLRIKKMNVDVQIVSNVARTRIELTFFNDGARAVEGEFRLKMPAGSIVNGFALDIDGQLVDGVLTIKERAEKAYTDRVSNNIDPGIAEVVEGDVYKTRIFPIPEKGRRHIALEYVTPLGAAGYDLPLQSMTQVGEVQFSIRGDKADMATLPEGIWERGKTVEGRRVLKGKNVVFNGALHIDVTAPKPSLTVHKSGQKFIAFPLKKADLVEMNGGDVVNVRKVRVYWDHSLSRTDADHFAERRILREYLRSINPRSVELITATGRVNSQAVFKDWNRLDTVLSKLDYDGASDLSALFETKAKNADVCLVFTDGKATLGSHATPALNCVLHVVSKDSAPNHGYLTWLASRNGGQFIGATHTNAQALEILQAPSQVRFLGGSLEHMRLIDIGGYPTLVAPYGEIPRTLDVNFATAGGAHMALRYAVDMKNVQAHDGVATVWGQRRADELRAMGDAFYDELIAHSQAYTLVGPETSLIVLEDIDDYIEGENTPPDNFPREKMIEYKEALADFKSEQVEARAERLSDVVDIWEDQKEWWSTEFSRPEVKKKAEPSASLAEENEQDTIVVTGSRYARESEFVQNAPVPAPSLTQNWDGSVSQDALQRGPGVSMNDVAADEVISTGTPRTPTVNVVIRKWSPDRPYLKALTEASDKEFEAVYRTQRAEYGDLPAFYLEVADLLYQNGQTELAKQRVLGALDLPSSNTQTQTIVASRLQHYGDYERAVELFRKVILSAPDRPQPHYDLALALIAQADHASNRKLAKAYRLEALEFLDFIIRRPWDDDYEGVELIALMEANAVIAQLPKSSLKKVTLDPRLIDNLDVDVRVVIDWNIDNADIDIWVDEPAHNGRRERAMYSNQLTEIGGQVSNDMTNGFGPEQYLLHRSLPGKYTVSANYFSSDAYNPNGAVSVRARIYQNYGRPNQSVQTTNIEFIADDKKQYVLGDLVVE